MNIQGGGISFEVSGTNKKLLDVLQQSKKAISTFSKEGAKIGADFDKTFEQAANAIQIAFSKVDAVIDENLEAIKKLQAENEKLEHQYAKQFMAGDDKAAQATKAQVQENKNLIQARQQIIDQAQPIIQELNEEEKKLQAQKEAFENNVNATKSLKSQLRECREQLALMEANGQRGTEAYRKMQAEAGRLTDALGDAATQAKILSHDNQLLQGTINAISGIAGGFTAAQGAVALFAGENENLQRIMLKVQSLMSITMGLQQVMNTLNKDSAFQLTIVARAKDMLTAANTRLATALGISTAAAQALMATLTLGLMAAVTAIVVLISRMSSESKKAAEEQDAFNKKAAEAAVKPLHAYMELQTEWNKLTNSMKEREKWVQDNADKFESLGFKVTNAKEAEELLVKNTSKFVEACMLKAKALAAQQTASEKYKEILEEQMKLEGIEKYETKTGLHKNEATGKVEYGVYKTVTDEWIKQQGVITKLEQGVKKYLEMQVSLSREEQAILAGIGQTGKVAETSLTAAQKRLARLQQQYNDAATDAERHSLAEKIAEEQKKINQLQLKTKTSGGNSDKTPKDPYLEMLQKRKTLYAKYSKWVQSEDAEIRKAASSTFEDLLKDGTSYLDYLEKQRESISGKATKTAEDLHKLTTLNNEIAEITKQTVLSDFEAKLNRELQQCNTVGQRLEALAKRREELSRDNSDVDRGKGEIIQNLETDVLKQAAEETKQLLQEYSAYTEERIKFEESYARKRELLTKMISAKEIDSEDAYIAELLKAKKAYEDYAREASSDDATIASSAKQRYAKQLKEGENFIEMLQGRIRELEDKRVKIGLDIEGTEQLEKLKAVLNSELVTDEQIKAARAALEGLQKQKKAYEKRSDSQQYDEMLEKYKTYQQQMSEVREKYAQERELAEKNDNYAMIAEINAQEQAEMSKIASQQLMATDSWQKLFSDLSKLSRSTIQKLIDDVSRKKIELSAYFNPADLQAINQQLENAKAEIERSDPFSVLKQSLRELSMAMKADKLLSSNDPFIKNLLEKKAKYKEYTEAIKSGDKTIAAVAHKEFAGLLKEGSTYIDNLRRQIEELEKKKITIGLDVDEENKLNKLNILLDKEVGAISELNGENFKKVMEAGNSLAENFKQITDCMSKIADSIGNEDLKQAAELVDDVLGNFQAAEKGSEAWGGWWGAVIGGVTDLVPKLVEWLSGDRDLEKQILKHQLAVKRLQNAYSDLEHQVKKSLGEEKYANQEAQIQNLKKQQSELRYMISEERAKKDSDESAILEYENQLAEAGRTIEDLISEITEGITQTTAKDLSNKLADAFTEAFEAGENAAESFGKVADEVIRNAVKNALKLQFLEKPLQNAIKQLQHDMGFDDEGNGSFDGLSAEEQARFKEAVAKAGANFAEAMKMYEDLFNQLDDKDPSTLSGAIKGASQESIDLLAGQANAVRVNQVNSLDIMRQQLTRLSNIDANIGTIAGRLLTIINKLSTPADDGLRSQGITD